MAIPKIPTRLIACLGNPGREHERDRHNVGFWLGEHLAAEQRVTLSANSRYHGLVGKLPANYGGDKSDNEAWLILPQTYMNLSGKAVGALARFFKITPEEILVIH